MENKQALLQPYSKNGLELKNRIVMDMYDDEEKGNGNEKDDNEEDPKESREEVPMSSQNEKEYTPKTETRLQNTQ